MSANVSTIEVCGQTTLQLKIGSRIFNADFIIAKNLAQNDIIGVDFLRPNGFIVDYNKNKLIIGDTFVDIETIEHIKEKIVCSPIHNELEPGECTNTM